MSESARSIALLAPTVNGVKLAQAIAPSLAKTTGDRVVIWTKAAIAGVGSVDRETRSPESAISESAISESAISESAISESAISESAISENPIPAIQTYAHSLGALVRSLWETSTGLVFVLATGAVVRTIAPCLQDKASDPPVVTVDETGTQVISLCGGHQGGGDALARQVAALLGTTATITSAAEGQGAIAVDILGRPYGWRPGAHSDWLGVARSLLNRQIVAVVQTCGWELWREELPDWHSLVALSPGDLGPDPDATQPANLANPTQPNPESMLMGGSLWVNGCPIDGVLWISDRRPPALPLPVAAWHPRTLWVGIGCERGTTAATLRAAVEQACAAQGLAIAAIAGFASVDLKRDEVGLLDLAQQWDLPIQFFGADDLATIPVPNPSPVVAEAVGTPSVAEAAALWAAGQGGALIAEKTVSRDGGGACTVAIARAPVEYTPRTGKIYLIGTGPGDLALIPPLARAALAASDVVIGYQLYLNLLAPLLHPTQMVEGTPITKERDRALRAIQLAQRGLTVAVVSSGDCGIYGMAGLVLECLAAQDWDGHTPAVETIPGITALQAAAARVGAPLMHDFCAISLSDLLTPWPVIDRRLEAAARADFVVALYNPRSQTRQHQIETAIAHFRTYRDATTPVILARSLYRPDETITLTTLAEVDVTAIDMLTVVLIGNASTFVWGDRAITPRGYAL